jgi:hypothetical protein
VGSGVRLEGNRGDGQLRVGHPLGAQAAGVVAVVSQGEAMKTIRCCAIDCGVVFGLPDHVYEQSIALGEKRVFWCPNGHSQWFKESEAYRLTARLKRTEADLEGARGRVNRLEDKVASRDRTVSYWKGIVTRLRGRR